MDRDSVIPICVAAIIFALGLGLFLYPYIQGFVVDSHIQYDAEAFLDRVDQIRPSVRIPEETVPVEPSIPEMQLPPETRPYADLWDGMTRYNEQIYRDGQKDLDCEYAYQQPSFSLMDYGLDNEIFGVISIPALELEKPIYIGATYSHLNDGAACFTRQLWFGSVCCLHPCCTVRSTGASPIINIWIPGTEKCAERCLRVFPLQYRRSAAEIHHAAEESIEAQW